MKLTHRWLVFCLLGALGLFLKTDRAFADTRAAKDPQQSLADLDAVVAKAMKKWHAAGVSVGVIKDGKIILLKGYGQRDVAKNLPVTTKTLFPIGSVSKSFTATLAAMMVDEHKLEWDKPVHDYLPWFQLKDPIANQLATTRDLLTHNTGLPGHDFIRYAVPMNRKDLIWRLRYLEPNLTFRQRLQYNNLTYTAAGYLVGELGNSTWEDMIRNRIFLPLGMTSSNTSVLDSQKTSDYSKPYGQRNGDFFELAFYNYQEFGVGPNGAVNSNAEDLLKYVSMHLNNGTVGDKRLVSEKQMMEMHRPQQIIHYPNNDDEDYGFAWDIQSYQGHKILAHDGEIFGFAAYAGFMPEDNYAFVVLSNQESWQFVEAVANSITDRVLGFKPTDWVAQLAVPEPEGGDTSVKNPGPPPTHPLSAYAGVYQNPAYGKIKVELLGDTLHLSFPKISGVVKPRVYDVFDTVFSLWEIDTYTSTTQFHTDLTGQVDSVSIDLAIDNEPGAKPIVFARVQ